MLLSYVCICVKTGCKSNENVRLRKNVSLLKLSAFGKCLSYENVSLIKKCQSNENVSLRKMSVLGKCQY